MSNAGTHNHELKLQRAAEHLRSLDIQVRDWLDEAYCYVAALDPQSGRKHIIMKVLTPPPATLRPIIVAQETTTPTRDVRSVLKSLLDHIGKDVLPPLAQYLPEPDWFNSVAQT